MHKKKAIDTNNTDTRNVIKYPLRALGYMRTLSLPPVSCTKEQEDVLQSLEMLASEQDERGVEGGGFAPSKLQNRSRAHTSLYFLPFFARGKAGRRLWRRQG